MASPTDQLPIRVTTERGEELTRPTVDRLRRLLERIGVKGDHFVILEPSPYLPREFMQTYRELEDDFEFEYREGDRQYATRVSDPEALLTTMIAWAERTPDWRTAHDWELVVEHETEAVPPLPQAAADYARQVAEELVAEGSSDFDDIVTSMCDSAEPDTPVSKAQAEAILEPLWLARVDEQRSWPTDTDPERLAAVFASLNETGITARMNFSCCQNCGRSEIREEAEPEDRGFVYYHNQDALGAPGGSLYLAFGAYSKVDPEGEAVGREAVAALNSAGFTTEWDGTINQRIHITGLDWKQRLS